MKRKLWRFYLWLKFHVVQRRRFQNLVIERIGRHNLVILPDVFNPTLFSSSEFFLSSLRSIVPPSIQNTLDLGTGSGIVAIEAAEFSRQVVAVDSNPEAVRCARINAILNRVDDKVEIRAGNLFNPVSGEKFDLILFNPPYFSGAPQNLLDQAFRSNDVASRFASELSTYLTPAGFALVVLSTAGQIGLFLEEMSKNSLEVVLLDEKSTVTEDFRLYKVTATPSSAG